MRYLINLFNSFKKDRLDVLKTILESNDNREVFLGVKRSFLPTEKTIENDAARMVRLSDSDDYSVFVKECWSEILKCLDNLMRNNLSDREVHFYRGSLSAICDLLRVSYKARVLLEDKGYEKERQEKK